MEFLILVGQRKRSYSGEYAPEALAVIDDYGNGENPDYLREEQEAAEKSGDFDSLAVLRVRVPESVVAERLYPADKPIDGLVI